VSGPSGLVAGDGSSGLMSETISSPADSTPDHVAGALRRRILTGELVPGTPLREVAVAREYGISRNTFRETIRLLVFDGLVQHLPNRGATVARIGAADGRDIYAVRSVLETAAVERAVRCRPADLTMLGAALADLEKAAASRNLERLVETDLNFHRRLVDVLGSDRMSAWFTTIMSQLRLAMCIVAYVDNEYDDPAPLVEEHRRLFDAIVGADPTLATSLLAAHLEKYGSRCVAVLRERVGDERRELAAADATDGDDG
jgi:DNA-binding GntR family transcriptional regulator